MPATPSPHAEIQADRIVVAGAPWAAIGHFNVLDAEPARVIATAAGLPRLVLRSGWIDPDDGPAMVWTASARAGLDTAVERLLPSLTEHGLTLAFAPRIADMLSDIPGTLSFLRKWQGHPLGIVLEPRAMLAESMVARAEEHLQRLGESLGEHPATLAVVGGDEPEPSLASLLGEFARAASGAGKLVIRGRLAF